MIIRPAQLRPAYSFLLLPASNTASPTALQSRSLHQQHQQQHQQHQQQHQQPPKIPSPTPFVPDPQTFLTLIGRNLSQHASKIPTWETLFSLTSPQLRELGVDPPRARRYLLRWRERFRYGQFGICGDAQSVVDGAVYLRVIEVPKKDGDAAAASTGPMAMATATVTPGTRKMIINAPPGVPLKEIPPGQLKPIRGLKLKDGHIITGPHVLPVNGGTAAKVLVKEGLWEDVRGHKVDGGERRQAAVRAKRRADERKAAART